MRHLLAEAARLGYKKVRGEYNPTGKNGVVAEFYTSLGFDKLLTDRSDDETETVLYELNIDSAAAPVSFLQPQ